MNNKYIVGICIGFLFLLIGSSPIYAQIERIGIEYSNSIRPNTSSTGQNFVQSVPANTVVLTTDFKIFKQSFTAFFGLEDVQHRFFYSRLENRLAVRSSNLFETFGLVKRDELFKSKFFNVNSQFGLKVLSIDPSLYSVSFSESGSGLAWVVNENRQQLRMSNNDINEYTPLLMSRISINRNILWDRLNVDLFLQYDYGFNRPLVDALITISTFEGRSSVNDEPLSIDTERVRMESNAIHYGLNIKWVFK